MSHHSRSLALKVFAHTFFVFLFSAYFCANWNIVPYATRTHTPGNTWCRAPGEFWKLCFDAGECGISLCANVNKQYVSDSNWVSVMYIYRGHSWLNVTIRNSSIMNIWIQNTWIDLCWKSLFLKSLTFFFLIEVIFIVTFWENHFTFLASTQAVFIIESIMEHVAKALKKTPEEVRKANFYQNGQVCLAKI